jgi:hypothetical protein
VGDERSCRGVVQLFNAITNAQKAKREAEQLGTKGKGAIKETKAALLQALHPSNQQPSGTTLALCQARWSLSGGGMLPHAFMVLSRGGPCLWRFFFWYCITSLPLIVATVFRHLSEVPLALYRRRNNSPACVENFARKLHWA